MDNMTDTLLDLQAAVIIPASPPPPPLHTLCLTSAAPACPSSGHPYLTSPPALSSPLQCLPVLPEVDALVLLELPSHEVHDAAVKVVSAQVGVAAGGQHLKHTVANLKGKNWGKQQTVSGCESQLS